MQRFSSIFSQLLQLFPRSEFESAVRKHRSDYAAKGFSSWGQFVAMLFCQLGDGVGPSDVYKYQQDRPKDHVINALSGDFTPVIFHFKERPGKACLCF